VTTPRDWRAEGAPYSPTSTTAHDAHEYLCARVIRGKAARGAGFRWLTTADVERLWPGETDKARQKHARALGALLYPDQHGAGGVARVFWQAMPGTDLPKFLNSPGSRPVWRHPGKTSAELWIVEGPFKGLAFFATTGRTTLAICGCTGAFIPGTKTLRPEVADDIKPGMRVYVLLDADCRTNSHVAAALVDIFAALRALGAIPVTVALPDLGDGRTGVDDYLASHTVRQFDALPTFSDDGPDFRRIAARIVERTELGLAEAFILLHGHRAKHDARTGEWFTWSRDRWVPGDAAAVELMKQTLATLSELADTERVEEAAEALGKFVARMQTQRAIRAAVSLASSDPRVAIDSSQFDQRPELLGLADGAVLNLETRQYLPASPELLVTQFAGAKYDPHAKAPEFMRFLRTITGGDAGVIGLIQEVFGLALSGHATRSQVFFFYGPEGNNGKSVLLELMNALAGDYAVAVRASVLLRGRGNVDPEAATPQLVRLRGKRLATVSEFARSGVLDVELLKDICGGDTISARGLNRDPVEFRNAATPCVRTNHMPNAEARDGAAWDRIVIVPFLVVIPEAERDPQLRERLATTELSGILRFALDGLARVMARGGRVEIPAKVAALVAEHRAAGDVLGRWLADCVELLPSTDAGRELQPHVYANFREWARDNGHEVASSKTFMADLRKRLGRDPLMASNGAKYLTGLRLVAGPHVRSDVVVARHMRDLADTAATPKERTAGLQAVARFETAADTQQKLNALAEFERLAATMRARLVVDEKKVVPFPGSDRSDASGKASTARGKGKEDGNSL